MTLQQTYLLVMPHPPPPLQIKIPYIVTTSPTLRGASLRWIPRASQLCLYSLDLYYSYTLYFILFQLGLGCTATECFLSMFLFLSAMLSQQNWHGQVVLCFILCFLCLTRRKISNLKAIDIWCLCITILRKKDTTQKRLC